MPEFTIEMLWDCAGCKAVRNLGLDKHCRNCGRPKDETCSEYMPDNVTVADALTGDKQRRAEAGPDFKCKFCGSLQNALNKCCTECGAPQTEGTKAWTATETTATFDAASGTKTDESEKKVDVAPVAPSDPFKEDREEYEALNGPIDPPRTDTPTTHEVTSYRQSAANTPLPRMAWPRYLVRLAIAAPSTAVVVLLGWLLLHSTTHDVHVSMLAWQHDVMLDRDTIHQRDGWVPESDAFDVQNLGMRLHHYDHVRVGSHNEPTHDPYDCHCKTKKGPCRTVSGSCYTTPVRCRSNKNGTASCSGGDQKCSPDRRVCDPDTRSCDTCYADHDHWIDDFKEVPVLQPYYTWKAWDWDYNRTVSHHGASLDESWPSDVELAPPSPLGPGEKEREEKRVATHRVVFADAKGKTWEITPTACDEFHKYPLGMARKIRVSIAGGVEVLP